MISSIPIAVRELGPSDYETTWRAMQEFTRARTAETTDEIWLTEHAPVYTLGLAGRREHLRNARGIPVVKVDRGGQVTYHGPGQVVAYLLFDLRRRRLGVRVLVRAIESAVIEWLGCAGVPAYGKPSAPGVYVTHRGREAKIAALGLRIGQGCSYHGLSVNIAMDLGPFRDIDPCGFPGLAVTQLADFLSPPPLDRCGREIAVALVRHVGAATPRDA